ncbi:MAG: hypothetical protein ACRC7H_00320 [Plesiomonas shigelloides]
MRPESGPRTRLHGASSAGEAQTPTDVVKCAALSQRDVANLPEAEIGHECINQ